jgi:hypothetical protein
MLAFYSGGATGAAAAAAIQAKKAQGSLVVLDPEVFLALTQRGEPLLVVQAKGGIFSTHYKYILGYRGLVFYTTSKEELRLPGNVEVMQAKKIINPMT